MAKHAGLEYYAKVPWKKRNFVANTGKKSRNVEDIIIFTKGKPRTLRPDIKKRKAGYDGALMHCTAQMLPTALDFAKPLIMTHQAEKPVDLLVEILSYVALEGEVILDQFAGSGSLGEAAVRYGVDAILIESNSLIK